MIMKVDLKMYKNIQKLIQERSITTTHYICVGLVLVIQTLIIHTSLSSSNVSDTPTYTTI